MQPCCHQMFYQQLKATCSKQKCIIHKQLSFSLSNRFLDTKIFLEIVGKKYNSLLIQITYMLIDVIPLHMNVHVYNFFMINKYIISYIIRIY